MHMRVCADTSMHLDRDMMITCVSFVKCRKWDIGWIKVKYYNFLNILILMQLLVETHTHVVKYT